jgi:type IV pilus assembly protein PilO
MLLLGKFEPFVDRLMKVSRPVRFAAIAAIALAIAGGYYASAYRQSEEEVLVVRDRVETLQRKLGEMRVISENLIEFESEVESLRGELDIALQQLPNRKQFEDLLQDVTAAGKKVGIQIESIQRAPEADRGFYSEVPFRIELEGKFHGIAMFFERVAKLPRIVNIGSLTVVVAQNSREETLLRVVGDATTFRFLAAPKDGSAATEPAASRASDRGGRV